MKKILTMGLIDALCLAGVSASTNLAGEGEAKVVATIQTAPEWEPLEI